MYADIHIQFVDFEYTFSSIHFVQYLSNFNNKTACFVNIIARKTNYCVSILKYVLIHLSVFSIFKKNVLSFITLFFFSNRILISLINKIQEITPLEISCGILVRKRVFHTGDLITKFLYISV